ncbi:Ig-like domain-containing protein [Sediminibacterium soli]|uniref:Ig-like domain-containing protein n=1 Tax=Sediminibacterium soli TaxID=2698829 RepID=UPI00137969C9|nr:gliding motility-associated C-terminal domain-containing protein [Sediminibacterium soli]NCI45267.1 gliding motility-associated C-terminal domain-containing protein [Sediminibacterium soli]
MIMLAALLGLGTPSLSQVTINLDLSANKDTTVVIDDIARNGNACSGSNCIVFNIKLNSGSDRVSLDVLKPAPTGASTYYQVNCGTVTSLATPVCISGLSTVSISFCKTGNDKPTYTISASSLVKASDDITLRQGCSGTMSVTGLSAASVTWTSITGTPGQYNSYLSCTSGCTSTTVTPPVGAPAYIDYRVSGSTTACAGARADTVRVYTTPPLSVAITPANPAICSGASTTLTATASGGNAPYAFSWSSGQTASSITTATPATYTVSVSDNTTGCGPITQTATVTAAPTPTAPTVSGVTICAGSTATLSATAPGGTYSWFDAPSGGNLLATGSSFTTPALSASTTYYVQTLVSNCSSSRTAVTVTVNPIPSNPTVNNATICAGSAASLNATAPGGTYQWYDAATAGNLVFTGSSFTTPALNASTNYYVSSTLSGCTSGRSTAAVTVNAIPAAPTASSATICTNTSASLQATAPGGVYEWYNQASAGTLLATGTGYTTPALTSNTTYYVQSTISGCTGPRAAVSVTITNSPAPPTAAGAAICVGNSTTLTATAPGGPYEWYGVSSGGTALYTGASYATPVLTADATYYVQAGVAGCMSSRTTVRVTVSSIPSAPVANNASICAGSTVTLTATGAGTNQWYDAASGGNLLTSGNSYLTAALNSSADYYVQTVVNGCAGPRKTVSVTVNAIPSAPVAAAVTICTGTKANLQATSPGGSYGWYGSPSGGTQLATTASYQTPALTASASYYVQTSINGCTSDRTAVPVTVSALPSAPTALPMTICAGNTSTLTASAPGGSYEWYDASSGGNLLSVGVSYTTATLTAGKTVYVQTTVGGCTGPRAAVSTTVIALPAAPSVTPGAVCGGNTVTLTATAPGGTYQWYDAPSGGTLLGGGTSYTSGVLAGNSMFYVSATISGCTGSRTAVPVTVTPIPAAPVVSGTTICAGNTTDLSAASSGSSVEWYDAAAAGNLLFTGNTFRTATLSANAFYYAQAVVSGCTSARTGVAVTVTPLPAAPTVADKTVCQGNAALFSATAPGGVYHWYSLAGGGTPLFTGANYATGVLSATTRYYVSAFVSGCEGPMAMVTANVIATPAAPNAAGTAICQGTGTTVTATAPGGVYEWYDMSASGVLLSTGAAFNTPVLNANTTYYVQSVSAGCIGPRTAVTVTVIPKLSPSFQYASGTFCLSGTNPLPTIAGGLSGLFSVAPAGLVFSNTATGEINLAASTPGSYVLSFVTSGACVYSSSSRIMITNTPNAAFSYAGPVCQQQQSIQPVFASGASAGVFSANAAGLVFADASTGEIDLSRSAAGTYTITNGIAAAGGCAATSASNTLTVNPAATARAGVSQTICAGNPVQLNGSMGGSATGITWSGGKGVFSNASQLSTGYTPAPNETIAKLFLITDDPAGPCAAAVDSLLVFITPKPANPVVSGAEACTGASATIIATSPGGVYEWYDAASGGTLLASAASYTTPVLTANTTYYVRSVISNCAGDRAPVTVKVAPPPRINSPGAAMVCTGYPMLYEISSDQAGVSYRWSRNTIAGISNAAASGFTSTSISEVLNNTGSTPVAVTYSIVPDNGSCTGVPFSLVLTVNPTPAAPGVTASSPVCVGSTLSLSTASVTGASYAWTGPDNFSSSQRNPVLPNVTLKSAGVYAVTLTVNGCTSQAGSINVFPVIAAPTATNNGPVCEGSSIQLTAGTLANATYRWTGPYGFSSALRTPVIPSGTKLHAGMYYLAASIAGCPGLTDSTRVTVNLPPTKPQVRSNAPICSSDSLVFAVDNIQDASYKWTGPNGFSTTTQNPVIRNTTAQYSGTYTVVANTPGCAITSNASVPVTVKPTPGVPTPASNSPVCAGGTLFLFATSASGANFQWLGKSGFSTTQQNPSLTNISLADSGTYRVVASLSGCYSDTALTKVAVVAPAQAMAGSDQSVCANNAVVQLQGVIQGDDTRTGIWASSGSGVFLPSTTSLLARYIPSSGDTAAGSVKLTLVTTNNKVCPVSGMSVNILITDAPVADAGADVAICSNDSLISLKGKVINAGGAQWYSQGTGYFNRSGNGDLQPVYVPSARDIRTGKVNFYLVTTGNGSCLAAADTLSAVINAAPKVNAGADRMIFLDDKVVLSPSITGNVVRYEWSPNSNLSSNQVPNAVLTGKESTTYTLRVTDDKSCTASDDVFIKVLKPIAIPNVFSPNGDGIHDTWEIPELNNYPGATVEIFGRSGMRLYYSVGYSKPWNGTYEGKPVPVATYYYIIHTNFNNKMFAGSVTVLR